MLLGLLARETDADLATGLGDALARLDPAAEDKRQARKVLLGLLARGRPAVWPYSTWPQGWRPCWPSSRRLRRTSVRPGTRWSVLAGETDADLATGLGDALARLDPAAEDKRQAREVLVGLLAGETDADGPVEQRLAGALARLATTAEDKRQAREVLLGLLARETDADLATGLGDALARLDPAAEDKRQAREVLLGLLARQAGGLAIFDLAAGLGDVLAQLDPTVHDLRTWRAWTVRPTAELLAAVRRNSALTNWLAALPSLTSLSGPPA